MNNCVRLFNCARCHQQVFICSRCDRGNIYCEAGCAQIARTESLRAAGRRYQASRCGRFTHAARQRRYRQRQKQKVTHQGSPPTPTDDSIPSRLSEPVERVRALAPDRTDGRECHFCGGRCSDFVRLDFFHGRRRSPSLEPQHPTPGTLAG
jgi:hypothetical protein